MKDQAMSQFDADQQEAKSKLYDAGFEDGKASVVVPDGGGTFSQANLDQAVANARAEDQVKLDALQAELDQAKADDQSDKDAIASKQAMLDKIKEVLGA